MKTLIYDNECPLCAAYTGAFVKTSLLEKEGRKNFNEISETTLETLDKNRCHNEIPLVDSETGKTWYGIDALLEILGTKMPLVKKVGQLSLVNWLLKKLYKLVSYNRKVIVAAEAKGYDCSPDFNTRYRVLFLLIGLTLNSWMFAVYFPVFNKSFFSNAGFIEMQLAHFSFVAVNIGIAIFLGKQKGLEFLGQVNMIALLAMLFLLPLTLVESNISGGFINVALCLICFFSAKEYIRRMKYAGIISKYKPVVALNIFCLTVFFIYLAF